MRFPSTQCVHLTHLIAEPHTHTHTHTRSHSLAAHASKARKEDATPLPRKRRAATQPRYGGESCLQAPKSTALTYLLPRTTTKANHIGSWDRLGFSRLFCSVAPQGCHVNAQEFQQACSQAGSSPDRMGNQKGDMYPIAYVHACIVWSMCLPMSRSLSLSLPLCACGWMERSAGSSCHQHYTHILTAYNRDIVVSKRISTSTKRSHCVAPTIAQPLRGLAQVFSSAVIQTLRAPLNGREVASSRKKGPSPALLDEFATAVSGFIDSQENDDAVLQQVADIPPRCVPR
jgi:hypothetical protein